MHVVQTVLRWFPPVGRATRMDCKLGLNRRGVRLFAWETLLPNCGPFPQISQRLAIVSKNLQLVAITRACWSRSNSSSTQVNRKRELITDAFWGRQGATPVKSR